MSGDQESSPQHPALAGSGHREGIRHTVMTYLGHTSPPASKGERPVQRPCSDQDVTTTARLRETYMQIYTEYVQLKSTSPPFSKVALLLAALTLKFVHYTQCLTNLLQGQPGTDCTNKVPCTNVRPPFSKVGLALAALLNKLVHYIQCLITLLQG